MIFTVLMGYFCSRQNGTFNAEQTVSSDPLLEITLFVSTIKVLYLFLPWGFWDLGRLLVQIMKQG